MGTTKLGRVALLVLDGCGCGAAEDASRYGDVGANTLGNLSRRLGPLALPNLARLGLGNLTPIEGVAPVANAEAAYGRMREASAGKDTTTGHWEMCGLRTDKAFPTFPDGFPADMLRRFCAETGRGVLGNKVASGTTILDELGAEHVRTGDLIVYTSADSVFQIAAHEEVVPIDELYKICEVARRLCDEKQIGRVIARPFVGAPGAWKRTYNRRDYSLPPPEPTVLNRLADAGVPVVGVGKISDIFAGSGVTESIHTEGNLDGLAATLTAFDKLDRGLVFTNLVDFDMLYGHRRDPAGFYKALGDFDHFLPSLLGRLREGDVVILTADHGNDPTFGGTDHTRELVPLIAATHKKSGTPLGERHGFFDIAATIADGFGVAPTAHGQSFLAALQ